MHWQNLSGMAKPMRSVNMRGSRSLSGAFIPPLPPNTTNVRDLERDGGRHDPAHGADDHSGVSDGGKQLAHRQLATGQRDIVRRQAALDPLIAVLDICDDDDGEATALQVDRRPRWMYSGSGLRASLSHSIRRITGRMMASGAPPVSNGQRPMSGRSHTGSDLIGGSFFSIAMATIAAHKLVDTIPKSHRIRVRRRQIPAHVLLPRDIAHLGSQEPRPAHEPHRQIGIKLGPRGFEEDIPLSGNASDKGPRIYAIAETPRAFYEQGPWHAAAPFPEAGPVVPPRP